MLLESDILGIQISDDDRFFGEILTRWGRSEGLGLSTHGDTFITSPSSALQLLSN